MLELGEDATQERLDVDRDQQGEGELFEDAQPEHTGDEDDPIVLRRRIGYVLQEIGLARFLTPGRANGLEAMVARIRALAGAYASAGRPAALS